MTFFDCLHCFRIWHTKDEFCLYMLFEYIVGGELFTYLRNAGKFNNSTGEPVYLWIPLLTPFCSLCFCFLWLLSGCLFIFLFCLFRIIWNSIPQSVLFFFHFFFSLSRFMAITTNKALEMEIEP